MCQSNFNYKQSSIVESHALNHEDAKIEHKDLIEFKQKLNNTIPGLIPSVTNIDKIDKDNDIIINKLYQFTRNYFKGTNDTVNVIKENSLDKPIINEGFDSDESIVGDENDSDFVLDEDEIQESLDAFEEVQQDTNDDNDIKIEEVQQCDCNDVKDNGDDRVCPYSADGNNKRYLELKEWVAKDSREINFGTTTSSYRNFIVELGDRFCTKDNLSKIHKVIKFNSKLKTFGIKFDKGNSGDAQNACILKSYGIDWKDIAPKKRNLAIEILPCDLRLHHNKGKNTKYRKKQRKMKKIENSVDAAMKYLNTTPKPGVFFLFGYKFDWDNKALSFKTAKTVKEANIFIQFRLKTDNAECTNTEYKYEFRVFTHWNKYAHKLELWQKAVCQIISMEIFKEVSQTSNYPFDYHGWQAWYRPFKREIKRLPGIQFEYFGIDKDGNGTVYSTPTAYAVKSEYYILIDPSQTESRLTKYINDKSIDLSTLSKENLNGDSLLQFPIDSYLWEIRFHQQENQNERILQHITIQQFVGYFLMIHTRSAGVAEFNMIHKIQKIFILKKIKKQMNII